MNFLNEELQSILVQAAENIVKEAKSKQDDGKLKKSIHTKEGDLSIQIIMEDYGLFQDKGVSGANKGSYKGNRKTIHKSKGNFKFSGAFKAIGGKKAIDRFMKREGISSNFMDNDSLNYLIRRSIYQHGIKPTLFLTKPYEKYREQIIEEFNRLHEIIKKDINIDGDNK